MSFVWSPNFIQLLQTDEEVDGDVEYDKDADEEYDSDKREKMRELISAKLQKEKGAEKTSEPSEEERGKKASRRYDCLIQTQRVLACVECHEQMERKRSWSLTASASCKKVQWPGGGAVDLCGTEKTTLSYRLTPRRMQLDENGPPKLLFFWQAEHLVSPQRDDLGADKSERWSPRCEDTL